MQGSVFRLCLAVLCLSCSSIYKMKLLAPPPCQYFKLMLLYHNLFSPSLSLHCPSVFCNNTHVWIIRICWRQPRRRPTQSLVFLACSVIQVSDHQQTPFLALSSSPPPSQVDVVGKREREKERVSMCGGNGAAGLVCSDHAL